MERPDEPTANQLFADVCARHFADSDRATVRVDPVRLAPDGLMLYHVFDRTNGSTAARPMPAAGIVEPPLAPRFQRHAIDSKRVTVNNANG